MKLSNLDDTDWIFTHNDHQIWITQRGIFMEIYIDGEWRGELDCTLQQAVEAAKHVAR